VQANGDGSLTYDEFVAWWEHGLSIEALSEPGGVSPAAPATTADAADLSSLPVLDEERLLHTLERRCRARCVYTSNGPAMLVAVNPYEQLPIYGDDAVERYSDAARLRSLPPHIYGLASAAFTELQLEWRSQMVLISGESGAGKTETAKAVSRKNQKIPAPQGWEAFNQATLYSAYERRTDAVKPDLEEYQAAKANDPEFYRAGDSLAYGGAGGAAPEAVDRMVAELEDRKRRSSGFSRRRKFSADKDVDYINDRNAHFNKKIERAFGQYTQEIKANLERGTALPDR